MKHIDTYKTPFILDLVVANKEVNIKDLQKKYTFSNGEELTEREDDIAYTAYCKNKITGRYTIIVKYNKDVTIKDINKKIDLVNTVAHEAVHVVMAIYDYVGEKVFPQDSNELMAYLTGWVSECIYTTWTKK